MSPDPAQDLINEFFEEEIKDEKKQAKKIIRLAKNSGKSRS